LHGYTSANTANKAVVITGASSGIGESLRAFLNLTQNMPFLNASNIGTDTASQFARRR
jgi:NAD(P)H-dependent FMN reductase